MHKVNVIPELLPSYIFECEGALKKAKKELKEIRHLAVQNIGMVKAEWFAEQINRKLMVIRELQLTIQKERYQ